MKMLGRNIDVRILGAADVKAYDEQVSKEKESEAKLYFAEENPLKTVSSTELEDRLKELDEQRQVLEAVQQLGTAQFDLTAERPMLGIEAAIIAKVASGDAKDGSATPATAPAQKMALAEPIAE